jgi:ATP synthase I chain
MTWNLPTIAGIQRATAILAALIALTLAFTLSSAAAIAALLGAAVMIVNLYMLAILGRFILGIAQHGSSAALGGVLAPLKMVLIIALVYVIIDSGRVNLVGFTIGLLTQLLAVFIETWRVSLCSGLEPGQP